MSLTITEEQRSEAKGGMMLIGYAFVGVIVAVVFFWIGFACGWVAR